MISDIWRCDGRQNSSPHACEVEFSSRGTSQLGDNVTGYPSCLRHCRTASGLNVQNAQSRPPRRWNSTPLPMKNLLSVALILATSPPLTIHGPHQRPNPNRRLSVSE